MADIGFLSEMLQKDTSLIDDNDSFRNQQPLVNLASDEFRAACWKTLRDPSQVEEAEPVSPLARISERRFKTFAPMVLKKLDQEALAQERALERKTAAKTARPKMVVHSALIKVKEHAPKTPRKKKKRAKSPRKPRQLKEAPLLDPLMTSMDSCLSGMDLPETPRRLRRKRWRRKKKGPSLESDVFLLASGFDNMTDEEINIEYWKIRLRREKEEAEAGVLQGEGHGQRVQEQHSPIELA